ncbi:hypothetical protein OV203_16220 [Nannocystis sp. ILAH1]|uniref:hypothetical protein n=1 Tax=unclassified Nannocystis TaxID=2627009 RepID=UPI00227221D7|nr:MULTISPECIES: hypothetical protein [unclassified Nannocystis]MCY0988681.1 hypothetical protein [Nannocystis sp. ILAH1]MCY1072458.1 hypothetical protein [Nannocystis sp. RBIL2]
MRAGLVGLLAWFACQAPVEPAPAPNQPEVAAPPVGEAPRVPAERPAKPAVRLVGFERAKYEYKGVVLDIVAVNETSAPAWVVLRIFESSPAATAGEVDRRRRVSVRPGTIDTGDSTPQLLICGGGRCDAAFHLEPGQQVSLANFTYQTLQKTRQPRLSVELWRLSALRFDGLPAERWMARAAMSDGKPADVAAVELELAERSIFAVQFPEPGATDWSDAVQARP